MYLLKLMAPMLNKEQKQEVRQTLATISHRAILSSNHCSPFTNPTINKQRPSKQPYKNKQNIQFHCLK